MIWQYRGITILDKYNYCLLWRNVHGLCFSHELINKRTFLLVYIFINGLLYSRLILKLGKCWYFTGNWDQQRLFLDEHVQGGHAVTDRPHSQHGVHPVGQVEGPGLGVGRQIDPVVGHQDQVQGVIYRPYQCPDRVEECRNQLKR